MLEKVEGFSMDSFKNILGRIKEFLQQKKSKVTDKMLAAELGIKPEYLSRCKATDHTPYEKVVHFCYKNGLDINYILFGKEQEDVQEMVKIKLLHDVYGSCGGGGEEVGVEYEWLSLDRAMLRSLFPTLNHKNLESIKAVGDSMEPSVKDGTIVFFDKNDKVVAKSGIFVLRTQSGIFIKRVQLGVDGMLELISENSIYPIQRVDGNEVFIIGRVLGSIERF